MRRERTGVHSGLKPLGNSRLQLGQDRFGGVEIGPLSREPGKAIPEVFSEGDDLPQLEEVCELEIGDGEATTTRMVVDEGVDHAGDALELGCGEADFTYISGPGY